MNHCTIVTNNWLTDADEPCQKGKQSGWRSICHRYTDQGTAGGWVGPKSDVSCFQRNWVSLYASREGITTVTGKSIARATQPTCRYERAEKAKASL